MARTRKADPAKNGAAKTEYVVLKLERFEGHETPHEPVEAWIVIGQFTAASKTQAIRLYTGDDADVIEGAWKAVPVSSWKGGETTKRVTAAARLPLE